MQPLEEQALEASLTEVRVTFREMLIVLRLFSKLFLCSQGVVREDTEAAALVLASDAGDGVPSSQPPDPRSGHLG